MHLIRFWLVQFWCMIVRVEWEDRLGIEHRQENASSTNVVVSVLESNWKWVGVEIEFSLYDVWMIIRVYKKMIRFWCVGSNSIEVSVRFAYVNELRENTSRTHFDWFWLLSFALNVLGVNEVSNAFCGSIYDNAALWLRIREEHKNMSIRIPEVSTNWQILPTMG